jgi:hypothetical protein
MKISVEYVVLEEMNIFYNYYEDEKVERTCIMMFMRSCDD